MQPNRFRPEYRSLTDHEKTIISTIKDQAEYLARMIEHAPRFAGTQPRTDQS